MAARTSAIRTPQYEPAIPGFVLRSSESAAVDTFGANDIPDGTEQHEHCADGVGSVHIQMGIIQYTGQQHQHQQQNQQQQENHQQQYNTRDMRTKQSLKAQIAAETAQASASAAQMQATTMGLPTEIQLAAELRRHVTSTLKPPLTSPTRWLSWTRTSVRNTSLKLDSPVI